MPISMMFRDRDGVEREIFGPEPIDAENEETKAELKRLKPLLASPDPLMSGPAEKVAEELFKRREELRSYAERWNKLVDDARRERRFELIDAINALDDNRD